MGTASTLPSQIAKIKERFGLTRVAEAVETLEVEIDPHAAVPGVFDQPREIARHRCDEAIQFAERLLGAPRCLHRLIALSHGAVDERLDALDQTELGVVLAPEPLESDERLEQERRGCRTRSGRSRVTLKKNRSAEQAAFMLAGAICSFAIWMLESCLRHGKA